MTGNESDPDDETWVYLWGDPRQPHLLQRGTFLMCLWIAGLAVAGWVLTRLLTA